MLDLEYGHIRLAENYLEQARSLEERDPRVITAYAYMVIKKASLDPSSLRSSELAALGMESLQGQIRERRFRDYYPYHVLGSQGLSWSRRAPLSDAERITFLRTLIRELEDGIAKHPRQAALRALLEDLRKEELSVVVKR